MASVENKTLVENLNQEEVMDRYNIRAPDFLSKRKPSRWSSLDIARGFAIILMILSHCVKGVMAHGSIPDWGIVPVHLITKFSSSLFILVFGVSLSLYFIPHIGKRSWKDKRWWMIKRGIELMLWYKILTVFQMFQYYPKQLILDTLMFKRMTDFVEILGFYSIALMWLPFFLPLWSRMGWFLKALMIVGTFLAGQWLSYNFDFLGFTTVKAILVEHKGLYTFGQFQRGALVFLGLYIGDLYTFSKKNNNSSKVVLLACVALGAASLSYFVAHNYNSLDKVFLKVAKNVGKHPFDYNFLSFSVGGALVILGLCLLMHKSLQRLIKPIAYIGRHSLNAFILHIIIIFYFYRYYFALHYKLTYPQTLGLTALCAVSIVIILYIWDRTKRMFK